MCIRDRSEAKPGDLIFFQKTYNTSGASHVGIYVGNGMMIHCGNPISYASIETSYWRQHYYCMGRKMCIRDRVHMLEVWRRTAV